jgi:hypothetical protein
VTFSQTGVATLRAQETVTDAAGTARLTLLSPRVGPLTVNAYFAGSRALAPSKGSAGTVVSRSVTTLTVTLPRLVAVGVGFTATARLVRKGGVPVAGQVVNGSPVLAPSSATAGRMPVLLIEGAH